MSRYQALASVMMNMPRTSRKKTPSAMYFVRLNAFRSIGVPQVGHLAVKRCLTRKGRPHFVQMKIGRGICAYLVF